MEGEKSNEDVQFKIETDEEKTISMDMVTLGLFGMSIQELINDIRVNKDGKYDTLYK